MQPECEIQKITSYTAYIVLFHKTELQNHLQSQNNYCYLNDRFTCNVVLKTDDLICRPDQICTRRSQLSLLMAGQLYLYPWKSETYKSIPRNLYLSS